MNDGLRSAIHRRRDNRAAGSHGLEDGYGQSLVKRWEDEQIAAAEKRGDVRAEPEERDPVRDAELGGLTTKIGLGRPRPGEDESGLRDPGGGLEQIRVPLLRM